MRTPLNLASRPIRNDRLAALLFAAATLILLMMTVHHSLVVRRLLPSRSAALRNEVADLQKERSNLRSHAGHTPPPPVTPQQKAEWAVLKELVDRRTFWWSELFASLEKVLPDNARIIAITPRVKDNDFAVDLGAQVDNPTDGLGFVHLLEERPEFEGVFPRAVNPNVQGGYEYTYGMRYISQAARENVKEARQ
jgi:hypothetical protein